MLRFFRSWNMQNCLGPNTICRGIWTGRGAGRPGLLFSQSLIPCASDPQNNPAFKYSPKGDLNTGVLLYYQFVNKTVKWNRTVFQHLNYSKTYCNTAPFSLYFLKFPHSLRLLFKGAIYIQPPHVKISAPLLECRYWNICTHSSK